MADLEVGAATSEASDCTAPAPTTTISTISLKSGDTRLVIALLQSREYLQLKVLEVKPDLTQLGATLQEAEQLQQAHDDVLQQLQSKQSPVEGLLRQADQLISTQKPRAEVYAAMAESLGLAWQDVNTHLEQRKLILDLNVAYQSRAEDCIGRMLALQQACQPTTLPYEIGTVKHMLTQLHELRRAMLEALMLALQDGKALLETLKVLAVQGTLDSRPDRIKNHAQYAVTQVELWLESLHDRRRDLDITWTTRKLQLEQCLALALLASDLYDLEEHLHLRQETLLNSFDQLGNSSSSAELLLHEHLKLVSEAKDMQDRALKITKATEQIVKGKRLESGDDATAKAYDVLHGCAEYLDAIEQRENMLKKVIAFFYLAHTALTKLDQLEVQLMANEHSSTSPQLAQLHAQASQALNDITEEPVQEGYALLETIGRGAQGAEGVRRQVEELENRKINLESLCTAHKEESLRVTQALTSFLEDQNELFSWLVNVAEAFLQGHQDMGSVLATAEEFLDLHHHVMKEVQKKGAEINEILLTLPPILEKLNDDQRRDVDDKVDNLHSHWLNMKCVVEARIDLANEYVKFHKWAVKLANAFDELEDIFKTVDGVDQDTISQVEQKWLEIQQIYVQLSNLGKSFIDETVQVVDPYLDVKRACLCVETLLEHFGGRRLTLETSYQSWETSVTHERQFQVLWERNVTESRRTVDWVSKLDAQLYPILTGDPTAASKVVARELEDKLNVALPEVKRALAEIELRIKTADTLALKGDAHAQNETIGNKLNELHSKLQLIFTDYQVLLQMLISFFKNLADLDKTIDNLQSQYRLTNLPHSVTDVELVLKEHDASRQAILELFKFTNNECQQIVHRIRDQEPQDCAPKDIERLTKTLEIKRLSWESAWMDRKTQLEQHRQLCHFDDDLHQINTTLNDLGKQLNDLRGQYGESLAAAKATSASFVHFEKTIELLEARIQTFISTAEMMVNSEHASSNHVDRELTQLKARWAAFRRQVTESRRLINLSTQYFTLIEEADEWFRGGNKLLVTIARKSTSVKRPEEATQLLNDVEVFLKPGEIQQDERIKKISRLAIELYGEERSNQVTSVLTENREMMESFTVISEELTTLSRNLTIAEQQRLLQKKEHDELDASLAEARAEAAAAREAASLADQARRSAEAAAAAMRDAVPTIHKTVDVGVEAMPQPPVESEPKQKSPPPVAIPKPVVEDAPKPVAPMFIIPLHDSHIQEGERFTFECSVTGLPRPDVIWYKDGMSIQNNADYLTSFIDGRCTLTIEETFTEDSATFTCTAGNIAGIAETSAALSVSEAEPDEILTPPVFTQHLHPSTAKEGTAYHLSCKVEGNPLPTVQWYKNDLCVDSSPDYVITYNNGDAVLRFEEVFLEDQAEYSCKAVNQQGSATTTANLNVEPLEPTEAPSFIAPLSNVMARAGQKIRLECEVTGIPTPELAWSHNGKPIKEARDVKVSYEEQQAVLVIGEAFPNDAGTYTLTAKNLAGEASSTCNVSVKGRLPTETSDSELASDMEPVKPAIQLQLKNLSVFEGTRVQLDCVIIGQPEPEVIWYHDGRPVKESPEFKLLFQGDRCSLVIQEVFLEDAGEYKVTAINSGGEASSVCRLTVTSVSATEPATRHHVMPVEEPKIQGSAPRFSKLLTDILASEGDKVLFECCVAGDPRPDIRWFLNNIEIQPKERMEFGEDAEGNVSLTILEVSPDNKGVYTAKASNAFGEAKCFATLIVKVTSSPDSLVRQVEEIVSPPAFRELFADRNVYENEATKFECIVVGKPTPKVRWCFNDEPVSGDGFLISTSGDRQVLSISAVTKDRVGKIACVAENEGGKASCVAILKIMSDAVPSETSSLVPVESSSITEHVDSSSFTMKRSVFVQSSSSHMTTSSTTHGSSSEPNVQVHSMTTHAHESSKQEGDNAPVTTQSQSVKEFKQINREQPMVREESFVKVTNGGTSLDAIAAPVMVPKSTRKLIAPRFMTPLNGKIVDQGTDIVFEGIIDGYPQPTVSWSKNGFDLASNGDSLTLSWSCNKARLELKGANVQDAGRYTCKAVNEVGSASSTADLVVKKTVFPPVFGRRLQAQMVKVGERVNMEVEVTGTPDPTVTWYKDGQQILGAIPGSKYRTKCQGNCYTLIIETASLDYSGKYMVRAVNAGGEAQSIADFLVYEPQPASTVEVVKHLVFEDVVHHTTQHNKEVQDNSARVSEVAKPLPDPPIIPNTLSFAPFKPSSTSETFHVTESSSSEKHVTVKMGHTSLPILRDLPLLHPKEYSPHIPQEEPKSVHIEVEKKQPEPETETTVPGNEGVESASISKQSAFDFFLNKMHENNDNVEKRTGKPVDAVPKPVQGDTPADPIVHRREASLFGNLDFHGSRPQYGSPVYALQPAQIGPIVFPDEHPSPLIETLTQSVHSTSSSMEEFFLQPEPPPEMGFSPKPEGPTMIREDVTSRVKRLEDSSRVLSPIEIPSGAVRIFPIKLEPLKQEPEPIKAPQKPRQPIYDTQQEVQEEIIVKANSSLIKSYVTGGDKTVPDNITKHWEPVKFETVSHSLPEEKPAYMPPPITPVERLCDSLPIMRPQADIVPRPTSPRPSAEAVSMEKLWGSRRDPEPAIRSAEILRPVSPRPPSTSYNSEQVWSASHTTTEKSETISSGFTEDIRRAASPRPSAEGVLMEKLWTPHKPAEPEPVYRAAQIERHSEKDKPSREGLKMDKIWAHKHKDSGLKKSWPPQEGVEERPILPWSSKTPDKVWPPVETKVSLTHKEVVEQTEVKREIIPEPLPDLRPEPTATFYQEPPANIVHEPPPPKPEAFHHVTFRPTEAFKDFRKVTNETSIINKSISYDAPQAQYNAPQAHYDVPQVPQALPTQHYVSESRVSHSTSIPDSEIISTMTTSSSEFKETHHKHFESTEISGETIIAEDRNWKPSEAKKNWPPNQKDEFVLNAPPAVRDVLPTRESPSRPQSFHELQMNDIVLEPGAPPEFGIARAPLERRLSYKETIEQELEKDLAKEPTRVPFGSVRIIPLLKEKSQPPPLPPRESPQIPPPIPVKTPQVEIKPIPKKEIKPVATKFERFPDLEPFPYKPEPSRPKSNLGPPPPRPSKFQKGEFGTSDYDSDMESTIIHPKWRPYESDTEDIGYRKVRPPSFTPQPKRPQSTDPEPLPPSRFDNPPQFQGPPRPSIDKVQPKKETKSNVKVTSKIETTKVEKVKKHHHHHHHHQEEKRKISPPEFKQGPELKPGSPPEFVQTPVKPDPKKIETPVKVIAKTQESGYMADTDEPRLLASQSLQRSSKQEETRIQTTIEHFTKISEKFSSSHESSQSSRVVQEKTAVPLKPQPIYQAQHRQTEQRNVASIRQSAPAKVLVPSPIPQQRDDRPSSLEPFPYSADPPQSVIKRPFGPPPPSPSKFLKGDFKESDYESDYDGRIPPRWRPDASDTDGPMFKPVRPILTPSLQSHPSYGGRTPTPPTEFDDPPQFAGPPRPKFTPIEKPPAVKLDEILKPVTKPQAVFKPKPVTAKSIPKMEVIIATPAVRDVLGIKPGSPPQMGYAPRTTTVKSSPYKNATQTETSNVVNFAESTEHSHRVVSVQQTTRIIKFGDKENKPETPQPALEPFPYKPDAASPKRRSGPPPTTPKKFVPGEFRESDYESEVEGVHFKPKWSPGDGGVDDLSYRKVQPPRSTSVPVKSMARVQTPMEFDTTPPVLTTTTTSTTETTSRTEAERLRRVEEMRRRFGENTTNSQPTSQELVLKPGSPPEMSYAPGKIPASASYAATKHMTEMTSSFKSKAQQFVNDIITDVETSRKPDKPILKLSNQSQPGSDDPQAYREESRLAEYVGSPWLSPNKGAPAKGPGSTPTPPSTPSTPRSTPGLVMSSNQITQPRKPPTFITPLRDIAVVCGQSARFECIVQAEPPPNVLWSSNGRILDNSRDYVIEYRNGVCRLTIPQATTVYGGSYTCTATNMLGTMDTTASLLVPGERRYRNI